ncbi:hypothetical protein K432DRAFT_442617 [Lepidopterella palustris CBS 459.81]|uniref:Uncharacterized protein n=1 Tax=Lepidopterella palustris CBS 459.81 TaxID=1314670 RepID=A0A8E2EC92_9PEZI|nr:hypothetical protein K432DRAFT_442617 [Lepidopterella palustris CBS 459.81]
MGNAASDDSFKGNDPAAYVEKLASASASKSANSLYNRHLQDYTVLSDAFSLKLPDPNNSSGAGTSALIGQYSFRLLFDTGSYHRLDNTLPPNLQRQQSVFLTNMSSNSFTIKQGPPHFLLRAE